MSRVSGVFWEYFLFDRSCYLLPPTCSPYNGIMNLKSIGFQGLLEDDERVVRVFRQPFHKYFTRMWARLLGWGGLAAMAAWYNFEWYWLWGTLAVWAFVRVFSVFAYWYVNGIVMTNEGVMMMDWKRFFYKRYNKILFFDLDQVGVEKEGLKAFIGNYGNLEFVQVGGDTYKYEYVNRPFWVAKKIEQMKEHVVKHKKMEEEDSLKEVLASLAHTHIEEKGHPMIEDEKEQKRWFKKTDRKREDRGLEDISKKRKEAKKRQEEVAAIPIQSDIGVKEEKIDKVFEGEDVDIEKELDDTGGVDIELK